LNPIGLNIFVLKLTGYNMATNTLDREKSARIGLDLAEQQRFEVWCFIFGKVNTECWVCGSSKTFKD